MLQPTPQTHATHPQGFSDAFAPLRVRSSRAEALGRGAEEEVLAFLSERPVHAVNLIGLIRDNGLESRHNRGSFYGCRDEQGRLEGVALVGHATLFEARTPRALHSLARAAQAASGLHLVLGEAGPVAEFWGHYRAGAHQQMRLACRELLLEFGREEARAAAGSPAPPSPPRLATLDDLPLVM